MFLTYSVLRFCSEVDGSVSSQSHCYQIHFLAQMISVYLMHSTTDCDFTGLHTNYSLTRLNAFSFLDLK